MLGDSLLHVPPHYSPSPDTSRRAWLGATAVHTPDDFMATVDLSTVGRGGLAGVSSAMDGAKQGTQEQLLPSPASPPRPAQQDALPLRLLLLLLLLPLLLLLLRPRRRRNALHNSPARAIR